jgi:hypothetical protein
MCGQYLHLLVPELMLPFPVMVALRWRFWNGMKIKIGRRALSTLPAVTRPIIFYDTDLTGFGLKASSTGGSLLHC